MALKPDRIELADGSIIKYFMNAVAERGIIVNATSGGGAGMDNPDATVFMPTGPSGNPVGVLMCDVVDLDLTRQHLNQHVDEVQVGNKVDVLNRGVVRTNKLKSGDSPYAGQAAHYGVSGELTVTTTSTRIGTFLGPKDADGYVELKVDVT